jgi:hypothetical protein
MLIRMLELASRLIIYLSCFIILSVDITGSTYHDCFSHLHYIITFNIYLHGVFIQRTPIYEHEGFAAYRLMYFKFFLSTTGQINWHACARLASRNTRPAPESSKSPNPFVCCQRSGSLLNFCINIFLACSVGHEDMPCFLMSDIQE